MRSISLDTRDWGSPRLTRFMMTAKLGLPEAIGLLAMFWHASREAGAERVKSQAELLQFLPCAPPEAVQIIRAMVFAGYVTEDNYVESDDPYKYYIVDNKGALARRAARVHAAKQAGQRSAALKKKVTKTAIAKPPVDTELQAACKATWEAYNDAYIKQYRTAPVRNAKSNTLIKQFVQRIPQASAPDVMRFYISHSDGRYLAKLHMLELAVADAESLHTQWKHGRAITRTNVRHAERANDLRSRIESIPEA